MNRLLKEKDFKSEKEIEDFIESLSGKVIPSMPTEKLTNEEEAQDLVFKAWDCKIPAKARKLIERALTLDPFCIEAFEFLGCHEPFFPIAHCYFERGVTIGRSLFLGPNFKEYRNGFWKMIETRPFMRCMHMCANTLMPMEEFDEAIKILEEMLKLNPDDNQGVRFQLMSLYLLFDELKKFLNLYNKCSYEVSTNNLFNYALYLFKKEGASDAANQQLKKAHSANPFVIPLLLKKNYKLDAVYSYSFGSKEDAIHYINDTLTAWIFNDDALDWLKNFDFN